MKVSSLILSTLAVGSILTLGGNTLKATAAEVAKRDTNGTVKFQPSTKPISPVNPWEPETPVVPVDPTNPDKEVEPGSAGPLSLDYATALNFGENEISTETITYNASAQLIHIDETDKYVSPYAQVTDNRGTLEGWQLSVKQNGQFKASSNASELKGAEISFKNGYLDTISVSDPGTIKSSFELDPKGDSQLVVDSKKSQAAGTWVAVFGDDKSIKDEGNRKVSDSVQLTVPGKSEKLKDTYNTTLTWMLNKAPENTEDGK